MKRETFAPKHAGIRLYSEEFDTNTISKLDHLQILYSSRLIHAFEQELINLQKKGLLWGALHPSFGMEVSASAALHALGKNSRINSTHRGHHHVIAKGLFSLLPEDWNPLADDDSSEEFTTFTHYLQKTCAEILGLKEGFCSGRGGSMHLYDSSVGVHGTNAIVGGALPAAVGLAFGSKVTASNEIIMSFFGDGASNQGTFHESCNLAGIYRLPVIFYLENNQYAVGTSTKSACSGDVLALRGTGYCLQVYQVDADDPIAVHQAVREAKDSIVAGGPPALIEAKGYRPIHHDSPLPGSAYGYRTKEEEAIWAEKSGYSQYPETLKREDIITQSQIDNIDSRIATLIDEVFSPFVGEFKNSIKDELWPDQPSETRQCFLDKGTYDIFGRILVEGVRGNGNELKSLPYIDDEWLLSHSIRKTTYVQAIAEVSGSWLGKDPTVYIWGEDVANFGQGPYGATKGLIKRYPDRILNMPISESAFVGMALGASMVGIKPIVEIMFPDFVLVAADQFFNQIAKARYMYGGNLDVPIVVRTRIATGTGMGPQHSMDPVALFSLFPGWRILAPSDAAQYIGLFNTAMQCKDPVLILEHHSLYSKKMQVPENIEYFIPFKSARVAHEGSQVTCITYGGMVHKLLSAAKELEDSVSLEVIDLRSVDIPSIDYETIVDSINKTHNVLFFEETPLTQSLGRHILYNLMTSLNLVLDNRPKIICSVDVPMPVSKPLEETAILSAADIITYFKSYWGKA
jgi:2-oxoisovalerate dehydrogenase E1 component